MQCLFLFSCRYKYYYFKIVVTWFAERAFVRRTDEKEKLFARAWFRRTEQHASRRQHQALCRKLTIGMAIKKDEECESMHQAEIILKNEVRYSRLIHTAAAGLVNHLHVDLLLLNGSDL